MAGEFVVEPDEPGENPPEWGTNPAGEWRMTNQVTGNCPACCDQPGPCNCTPSGDCIECVGTTSGYLIVDLWGIDDSKCDVCTGCTPLGLLQAKKILALAVDGPHQLCRVESEDVVDSCEYRRVLPGACTIATYTVPLLGGGCSGTPTIVVADVLIRAVRLPWGWDLTVATRPTSEGGPSEGAQFFRSGINGLCDDATATSSNPYTTCECNSLAPPGPERFTAATGGFAHVQPCKAPSTYFGPCPTCSCSAPSPCAHTFLVNGPSRIRAAGSSTGCCRTYDNGTSDLLLLRDFDGVLEQVGPCCWVGTYKETIARHGISPGSPLGSECCNLTGGDELQEIYERELTYYVTRVERLEGVDVPCGVWKVWDGGCGSIGSNCQQGPHGCHPAPECSEPFVAVISGICIPPGGSPCSSSNGWNPTVVTFTPCG